MESEQGQTIRQKVEIIDSPPSHALQQQSGGEMLAAIADARDHPRNIQRFRDIAMEMATVDEETACECFYKLSKGGKAISGPSIRLAEIVLSTYHNLWTGSRPIEVAEKVVVAQGVCIDLETGTRVFREVNRRITDRNGKRYQEDTIQTTMAAACAIAMREAVFKVVPRVLVNPILRRCYEIAGYGEAGKQAKQQASEIEQRRTAMLKHFEGIGVTTRRVLFVIGRSRIEDITPDDLVQLRGTATAIKDNEITAREAFGTDEPEPQQTVESDPLFEDED